MADHERSAFLNSLLSDSSTDQPLSSQSLARIRALILNPSTADSELYPLSETLTRSLQLSPDHRFATLLSALSTRLNSSAADPTDGGGDAFASLCFGASPAVRMWLLRSAAGRRDLRPYLKLTLFLGFTKDPLPCVRSVALDGLVSLGGESDSVDGEMIGGCYSRAVQLLLDADDGVRVSAIRAVCAWGSLLSESNPEMKARCSDEVFVKLCSMARDMSMKVRAETFIALGQTEMVSEDILLQTLSKKVLGFVKENQSLGQCSSEQFKVAVSSAAGALLHGLEDEFYEVRKSACCALSTLILFSVKFAVEALELLIDMLNDGSVIVRLQALDTMRIMAACDRLKLQEKHMHMFLGPLVDKNTSIRHAARKILKLVKLSFLKLFKLTVDTLLQNLAKYPEDEADVFSALFHIGRNHGKFVVRVTEDIYQQIEPTSEGKLDFDNPSVAALIVLAISAPILGENACTIPPTIYSYAVTILGRISNALSDVIDQSSLLTYLSQYSMSTRVPTTEFKDVKPNGIDVDDCSNNDLLDFGATPMNQLIGRISIAQFLETKESQKVSTAVLNYNAEIHDQLIYSMKAILAKVKDTWPLVLLGNTHQVLMILRSCKEELSTFNSKFYESFGVVSFTRQYVQIVKLLSKVSGHFFRPLKCFSRGMGMLDVLFGSLERRVRELRTRFIGLSKEEELHILELTLLICTLRLSKIEICCKLACQKTLTSILLQIESLVKEASVKPSEFVIEVGKGDSHFNSTSRYPFTRLAELFCLRKFEFSHGLKYIRAELDVPNNDFEKPISFVPGLPVGVFCSITLHNVSVQSRLWLRMMMDDGTTQFIYTDLSHSFEDRDGRRKLTLIAPFYRTPKAMLFRLKLCIGMECPFEDLKLVKICWGPSHELAYLCKEREVFLALSCKV